MNSGWIAFIIICLLIVFWLLCGCKSAKIADEHSIKNMKPKFKIGDNVKYSDIEGNITSYMYDEQLGFIYLVKYYDGDSLVAFENSLMKVGK